ncbi:hypothetical protein ACFLTG_02210 [Chloroflexota bacterium]
MAIKSWKGEVMIRSDKDPKPGDDVYVLYTWCRMLTITLCSTMAEAKKAKKKKERLTSMVVVVYARVITKSLTRFLNQ